MKRILKVLAAMALMVMLMATTVSPAFATHTGKSEKAYGWKHVGVDQYGDPLTTYKGIGYGKLYPPNEDRHEY